MSSLPVPSEDAEQVTVVQYLETRGMKFTAIPNHTWTPSIKAKVHNKRIGLRAGLPDLLVVLPDTGLLFIEMKRTRGSTTSPEQKAWIETLNTIPGVVAGVCKGAEEAIKLIEMYYPLRPVHARPTRAEAESIF